MVIERSAGTVSSSGPPGSTSTRRSAISGRCSSTGSSSRNRHSSTRVIAATATTGFVIDEMRKIVFGATGREPSSSSAPIASTCTSSPRATAATSPGTSPRSTCPAMTSC